MCKLSSYRIHTLLPIFLYQPTKRINGLCGTCYMVRARKYPNYTASLHCVCIDRQQLIQSRNALTIVLSSSSYEKNHSILDLYKFHYIGKPCYVCIGHVKGSRSKKKVFHKEYAYHKGTDFQCVPFSLNRLTVNTYTM